MEVGSLNVLFGYYKAQICADQTNTFAAYSFCQECFFNTNWVLPLLKLKQVIRGAMDVQRANCYNGRTDNVRGRFAPKICEGGKCTSVTDWRRDLWSYVS